MKLLQFSAVLTFFLLFTFSNIFAQETNLMVRVKSKDAKFVGSSIGGAKIIIRNDLTGEILAEGVTSGSTGNTDLIMQQPQERGKRLTDSSTAGYNAVLNISEPTFVTIEAFAPVNKKQAVVKSSTQLWVLPGKDITEEGIILEVPGFVVDVLSPQTHERVEAGSKVTVKANIVMMCGCPVTEGGIWNADDYEIAAQISKEGKLLQTLELEPEEKASTFSADTNLTPGNYEILVYAFDPSTGNTGLDKVNIIVN